MAAPVTLASIDAWQIASDQNIIADPGPRLREWAKGMKLLDAAKNDGWVVIQVFDVANPLDPMSLMYGFRCMVFSP